MGLQPKTGGKFLPKLNIGKRPIANKYREGKMKRTLKRELKVREIAERETLETVCSVKTSACWLQAQAGFKRVLKRGRLLVASRVF